MNRKGYRLYNQSSDRVIHSRDVRFNELCTNRYSSKEKQEGLIIMVGGYISLALFWHSYVWQMFLDVN